MKITAHNNDVRKLAISPEKDLLASGDGGGVIYVWNYRTGEKISQLNLETHYDTLGLAFCPQTSILAISTTSGDITIWDFATHKIVTQLKIAGTDQIAWSPDGQFLVCGTQSIHVYKGAMLESAYTLDEHGDWITSLRWSSDSRQLISGSAYEEGKVRIWDTDSKQLRHITSEEGNNVSSIALLFDGDIFFSRMYGNVYRWSPSSNTVTQQLEIQGASAADVLSNDGKLFACEIQQGDRTIQTIRQPDGTFITTFGEGFESAILVIDTASGKPIHAFTGHIEEISDLVFSPDNTKLVSADWGGVIHIWDIQKPI